MRPYFSSYLLWTAEHLSEKARDIEIREDGRRPRFDMEQRSYVLSSLIASGSFLEAMVNELYQDAVASTGFKSAP